MLTGRARRRLGSRKDSGQPSALDRLRERDGLRLALLSCAQFVLVVDATIVLVSLPTISKDLHFNAGNLQWIITFYGLTFGGFLMLGGRAADVLGRRRMFMIGLATFAVMSAVCAVSQSQLMLIIGRAGQGLGAAMASPAALSLLTGTFPEGKKRNVALGVWSAVGASGGAAGNVLGGVITSTIGWRWIFTVNIPICAMVIVGSFLLLPVTRDKKRQPLDAAGALTVTVGLGSLIYALSAVEEHGLASPAAFLPLILSFVFLVAFGVIESRIAMPLLPYTLLNRPLVVGNVLLVLGSVAGSGTYYFASLFFQQVRGHSPMWTGFAFVPWAAAIVVCSLIASRTNHRFGGRPIATAGFAVLSLGCILIALALTSTSSYAEMLPAFLVIGIGSGFIGVTNTIAAMSGVDKRYQGVAAGLTNSSQRLGSAIGLAVLATVATGHINSLSRVGVSIGNAELSGYRLGIFVTGAIAFVGAIGAFIFVRSGPSGAADKGIPLEQESVILESIETSL
jgi:EmrB/QacA subfamily drug resistance transporter